MNIVVDYEDAINKIFCNNSDDEQIVMAIEEMSELTKELCKHFRTDCDPNIANIIEEIGDVLITVTILSLIFGEQEVKSSVEFKFLRYLERLGVE